MDNAGFLGCSELWPSPTSLLTPYSSPNEKPADQYAQEISSQELNCLSDAELGLVFVPIGHDTPCMKTYERVVQGAKATF